MFSLDHLSTFNRFPPKYLFCPSDFFFQCELFMLSSFPPYLMGNSGTISVRVVTEEEVHEL